MGEPLVAVRELSMGFGRKSVLNGVSLSVAESSVYVLLGRNGEGKTTLIRCLLGQLPAQSGGASILGRDAWRHRRTNLQRLAVVPESPRYAPGVRVRDLLRFLARVQPRWDHHSAQQRLAAIGIGSHAVCDTLSRGQKTQLALLTALASRPRLLVCDDPTLGLDPLAQRALLDELIVELAEHQTTVFVTTHDLATLGGLADRIGILHQGHLIVDEPADALRGRFRRLEFDSAESALAARRRIASMEPLPTRPASRQHETVVSRYDGSPALEGTRVASLSLEEIFVTLVGTGREVADA